MKKVWIYLVGVVVLLGMFGVKVGQTAQAEDGGSIIGLYSEDWIDFIQDAEFVDPEIDSLSKLKEYEQFYTKEYFNGFNSSDDTEEGVSAVQFSYGDIANNQLVTISIYNRDKYPYYNALDDFKKYYPDGYQLVIDMNDELELEAEQNTQDRLEKFDDILECLNVIDKKEDENGNVTEATFYCNENKKLVIDDPELLHEFVTGGSRQEWEFRSLDYSNLDGYDYDEYNPMLEMIKNGKLLLLEKNDEGNITLFAMTDESRDEMDKVNVVSGKYDVENKVFDPALFVLGWYIINDPEGWQEKLDWFENERDEWRPSHPWIFQYGEELSEKWLSGFSNDELYDNELIPFKDIPRDAWYLIFLQELKNYGIVSGFKDAQGNATGYFGPDSEVTVAEFIKMALNSAGMGEKIGLSPALYWENTDVNALPEDGYENHWALKFYKIAKYLKTRLVSETEFSLNRPIKRKEVVGFIKDVVGDKMLSGSEGNASTSCFSDLDTNDTYSADICFFKQLGLVSGYEDRTFKGDSGMNRAEVSKMVYALSGMLGNPVSNGDAAVPVCTACENCILFVDFIKNLIEESGFTINVDGDPIFENIEQSNAYYNYLATAYNAGVIDNSIGLYDTLSKAEAIKIIVNLLNLEGGDDVELVFPDVSSDAWYSKYLKILIEKGVIENSSMTYFEPSGSLTKDESAVWLSKI